MHSWQGGGVLEATPWIPHMRMSTHMRARKLTAAPFEFVHCAQQFGVTVTLAS